MERYQTTSRKTETRKRLASFPSNLEIKIKEPGYSVSKWSKTKKTTIVNVNTVNQHFVCSKDITK